MNLQTVANRYYLLAALGAFVLGGILAFLIIRNVIYEEVDDTLIAETQELIKSIKTNPELTLLKKLDSYEISLSKQQIEFYSIKDTLLLITEEEEGEIETDLEPYRQLELNTKIGDAYYRIVRRKSLIESEDILFAVFLSFVVLFFFLLLVLYGINRWLHTVIWKPFYDLLKSLRSFQLSGAGEFRLPKTEIDEFVALNQAIESMTNRIQQDYLHLKIFTENASHEIQTPLAKIRSNLDMLMQEEGLTANHVKYIEALHQSTNRLSKLNEALILLSRIENQQFKVEEQIDLRTLVGNSMVYMKELAALRHQRINTQMDASIKMRVSPSLIKILIDNLLKNAISHSQDGAEIYIKLTSTSLQIQNPGQPFNNNPETLFQRFQKEDPTSTSLGLGLAISQKICETYGFELSYEYQEGNHGFSVNFNEKVLV